MNRRCPIVRFGLVPIVVMFATMFATVFARADDSLQDDRIAFFETHIRPLLAARCYSCHSVRADASEGGLRLDTRDGWETGGDGGTAIVPGDVDASALIRAVRYDDADLQMPPDRKLSDAAIARLEQWVRMGAPDPRVEPLAEMDAKPQPSDPIAGRQHWAFRPLDPTQVRHVDGSNWPSSEIDAFVLTKLVDAGLRPVADADRPTLLRRLFVQLTGLPPNADQVAAFASDDHPDALARQVDRLLDDPAFGERWGRHWMDLARYADSNGLDENFLFREAWRYRNEVIQSINEDTAFDRFLTEQIAGDLLPYQTIAQRDRQRTAAGFMVIGPKVLLGIKAGQQRMDIADEQLDTIGRAVLGQTLGCARCHDHKFDPIPTVDYYALAGIMTSTQVMEKRYMLGQQRVMERLVGLGLGGDVDDAEYETYWREQNQNQQTLTDAQAALALLKQEDETAIGEFAATHQGCIAIEARNRCLTWTGRVAAQQRLVDQISKRLTKVPPIPPRAMIPSDAPQPSDEAVRLAGQYDRLGDAVPRGFLSVLSDDRASIPDGSSGRLELAHWLTDTSSGAGHLAARVMANRVWHHLIGRGIVRTVDNFGRTGEAPTHPELLDYLATELIASGWSIKALVRKIVLSRTFAISSQHDTLSHSIDPENQLLWRAHRRRVDPETLRDSMLLVAGMLDRRPVDSTVSYLGDQATAVGPNANRRRTDFPCRSVYLPVIRNDLPELFQAFDFANPHTTTGMRPETMVAMQGLFVLNDVSVMQAARATAQRVLSVDQDNARVDHMFLRILSAAASDEEHSIMLRFVDGFRQQLNSNEHADAELTAWSMACQALMASSRFQILE